MILQIDDNYFNPLTITRVFQNKNDVHVYFCDSVDEYLVFKNWKVFDLAAEINRCIKEF